MNLKQLEAFVWVGKLGSFSKTAERLFTTQPAISSRIANLEDELQTSLFVRDGPRVLMTAAGRALLPDAERALSAVAAIHDKSHQEFEVGGVLRLGASETIVHSWLPDLLAHLRMAHPNLNVEINVDVTAHLRDELVDHAIDIAFLMGPVSQYRVRNINLNDYPLVWAMRPEKGMRKRTKMSMEEMMDYPLLTYHRTTRPYAEIERAFKDRTGKSPRLFPSSSLSACQRMAERGVGIATLPRQLITRELEDGKLIEVQTDWTPSPLNFTASYIPDPVRPILGIVAEMAAEMSQRT